MPPSQPPTTGRSGRRRAIIAGGGAVGLALAGGAAAGAYWFLADGAQAAQALPASTIGYVSVNLDPSGQQLLAARETLEKFPAWQREDIGSTGDLREWVFEQIKEEGGCTDIDYANDIAPWLGDRMALAAVDAGGDTPAPVFSLEVTDESAADAGLEKLAACASTAGSDEMTGWTIKDGWALIAETDEIADDVASAAADSPLSEDADFQKWTGEAGAAGIMTMYAAPAAGEYLADSLAEVGDPFALGGPALMDPEMTDPSDDSSFTTPSAYTATSDTPSPDAGLAEAEQSFRDFAGMAGTVRFDDGSLEVEFAGDAGLSDVNEYAGEQGADVVSTLPEDTVAAMGVSLADGWAASVVDSVVSASGGSMSAEDLLAQASSATGLELPADAETLAGDSIAIALGSGFDIEALVNSADTSGLPLAVKVEGDAVEIETVLDKLRTQLGAQAGAILGSESDGDMVAVGPSPQYVSQVVQDGGLGDTELYRDVVRQGEGATGVLFVNLDEVGGVVSELTDDQEVIDNLEPLAATGMSAWLEDDVSHSVLRVTTD